MRLQRKIFEHHLQQCWDQEIESLIRLRFELKKYSLWHLSKQKNGNLSCRVAQVQEV